MANNNNNIIYNAQAKLMTADPFLVEALSGKTVDELQDKLMTLQEQLSFVSTQSPAWKQSHNETIEVIECILMLRRMGNGDQGGVTLV